MNELSHINNVLIDGLKFCSEVYAIFEKIRQHPTGIERLRKRETNVEKLVLEELLPICHYIQTFYRPGRYISVRWIDGSQSFDAEFHQEGDYIKHGYFPEFGYLEVTSAMHKNEHETWKLDASFAAEGIKRKGKLVTSEPVSFEHQEHVEKFVPIVLKEITKKIAKDYPENTSLIVQCYLNTLYLANEWENLVQGVKNQLPKHSFREILIFDGLTYKTAML